MDLLPLGDLLRGQTSRGCVLLFHPEEWSWYFKPFNPHGPGAGIDRRSSGPGSLRPRRRLVPGVRSLCL